MSLFLADQPRIEPTRPAPYSRSGGDLLDLCVLVDRDLDDLAVIAAQPQCRLLAIRRLAPHLDPADRPSAVELKDSLNLR
jgi:hypothetical protein